MPVRKRSIRGRSKVGRKRVNGQWMRYDPSGNGTELTHFDAQAHVQTVKLEGASWIGTGLTIDDTTGDEKHLDRVFNFCLIHNENAL